MFPNKLQSIESVVFAEAVAAESTQDGVQAQDGVQVTCVLDHNHCRYEC